MAGIFWHVADSVPEQVIPIAPWTVDTPGGIEVSDNITSAEVVVVTALQNGNFMAAYSQVAGPTDKPLYVSIYDPSGSLVGSEILIGSVGVPQGVGDINTLTNGNVVLAFQDGLDSDKAKFTILSPTGSTVKAVTDISAGAIYTNCPRVVPMSTGGFMIVYTRTFSDGFQAVVFDAAGAVVNTPSEVSMDIYGYGLDAKETQNGDVIVAFYGYSSEDLGYMILNPSGVVTYTKADINGNLGQYPVTVTVLDNSNYFIAWYDDNNLGGSFMIFNTSNAIVVDQTELYTDDMPGSYFGSVKAADTLTDGSVIIRVGYSSNKYALFYEEDGTYIETVALGQATSQDLTNKITTQLVNGTLVCGSLNEEFANPSRFYILSGS